MIFLSHCPQPPRFPETTHSLGGRHSAGIFLCTNEYPESWDPEDHRITGRDGLRVARDKRKSRRCWFIPGSRASRYACIKRKGTYASPRDLWVKDPEIPDHRMGHRHVTPSRGPMYLRPSRLLSPQIEPFPTSCTIKDIYQQLIDRSLFTTSGETCDHGFPV